MTDPTAPDGRYNLYLAYARSDADRVKVITDQLSEFDGIRSFDDHLDVVPGASELDAKQAALRGAGSIAVVLGPGGTTAMLREEATQALRRSIEHGTRAFLVWLPDSDPREEVPEWLRERGKVDLSAKFDDGGRLTSEGLAYMVAGVRNMTPRDALNAVQERLPRRRALLVTIGSYLHYDALDDIVASDRLAVESALGGSDEPWEVERLSPRSRTELWERSQAFFDAGKPQDTMLFYFSGHGDVVDNEAYLVVGNSRAGATYVREEAFPLKTLADAVRGSRSPRKIVVLDCCHSGEASDGAVAWGDGVAVFTASRQWIPASGGVSDLTRAFVDAWATGPATTGDLFDRLDGKVEIRSNDPFDRRIPLPTIRRPAVVAPAPQRPSARLVVDKEGELHVVAGDQRSAPTAIPKVLGPRRSLATHLIQMIDNVMSLVDPEQIPIDEVAAALQLLGSDMLGSTITDDVRSATGLDAWDELRLEISVDDGLADRDLWDRVPWEALSMCTDHDRRVALERIVRGRQVKGAPTPRDPARVLAWNALTEPDTRYPTDTAHVLTHLLRTDLPSDGALELHVVEPASWGKLVEVTDLTAKKVVAVDGHGRPQQNDLDYFDTLVIFDGVKLTAEGEPRLWMRNNYNTPTPFVIARLEKWSFSRVVIETIAGDPRDSRDPFGAGTSQGLQATNLLAARLARGLQVPVVAVCHSRHFLNVAREDGSFQHSFSGLMLGYLAGGDGLLDAALRARQVMTDGFSELTGIHIGLPVVFRPETATVAPPPSPAPLPGRTPRETAPSRPTTPTHSYGGGAEPSSHFEKRKL